MAEGLAVWLTVGPDGPRLVLDGPGVDAVLDPAPLIPALRTLLAVLDPTGGR